MLHSMDIVEIPRAHRRVLLALAAPLEKAISQRVLGERPGHHRREIAKALRNHLGELPRVSSWLAGER